MLKEWIIFFSSPPGIFLGSFLKEWGDMEYCNEMGALSYFLFWCTISNPKVCFHLMPSSVAISSILAYTDMWKEWWLPACTSLSSSLLAQLTLCTTQVCQNRWLVRCCGYHQSLSGIIIPDSLILSTTQVFFSILIL